MRGKEGEKVVVRGGCGEADHFTDTERLVVRDEGGQLTCRVDEVSYGLRTRERAKQGVSEMNSVGCLGCVRWGCTLRLIGMERREAEDDEARPVLLARNARRVQAGVVVARVGVLRRRRGSCAPAAVAEAAAVDGGAPRRRRRQTQTRAPAAAVAAAEGGVCVAVARVVAWQLSPCPCFPWQVIAALAVPRRRSSGPGRRRQRLCGRLLCLWKRRWRWRRE